MESRGVGAGELLVVVVAGAVAAIGGVVWTGAWLAAALTGGDFESGLGDAIRAALALPSRVGSPSNAWPASSIAQLPGPVVYWSSTGAVAASAAGAAALGLRLWRGPRVGSSRRRLLGVDSQARLARPRDLRPLVVRGETPGRLVLGRHRRRSLATEDGKRRGRRAGDRGAVALVGPSRSGKTTAIVGGILEWDGPAILSSVKADLLGATLGYRSTQGKVHVYDPTQTTSATSSARWSPLRAAGTTLGAQRAARSLCDAAPKSGVEGGMDFWLAQAEILLSGLLWTAHHAKRDMAAVADWVLTQDRPGELGDGDVCTALNQLMASDDNDVAIGAAEAYRSVLSIWEMEDRTRSSVYATAQTVVWPWSDPGVAGSARKPNVRLEWLLAGTNTLYLCAPIEDQQRLAPAFGGLLNDLIKQVYLQVSRTGEPIDPPLLIVIDEAGNTPLRALPEYASTLAGLGVVLVTIWQSLAQMQTSYGRAADTILTNHLSKVFYAGLSDEASLRYITMILGEGEVETRSRQSDAHGGRSSMTLAASREKLAPAHVLRQMRPGDAVLVHGTLPPAHLRTRPYFADRRLAARAAIQVPARSR